MALSEISYMIKHIKKFSKRKRVRTPIAQFRSRSYIQPIPYGNTLIMSPWNYPFLLTIDPLATAIAAGKYKVIAEIVEAHPEYTVDDLKDKSMAELKELLPKTNNDKDKNNKTDKDNKKEK